MYLIKNSNDETMTSKILFFIINLSYSMNLNSGALRLQGFDKPTVFSIMTQLAVQTKSVNLGQGFYSWDPPQFYITSLQENINSSSHQYVRAFGSLNLTEAIAKFHQSRKAFNNVNHETDIVTVNGGAQGLHCSFLGLVNKGEEVILFDPSYDCYRPQVQMAGGKCVGVPLKPKYSQSKAQLVERSQDGFKSGEKDEWQIDFQLFQKSINEKTKILLLNSPHNPVGKVLSLAELQRIAAILKKHPQVLVIEDNVYEGMTFDDMFEKPLPKIAFLQGMYDRTVSVYSAGKIFAVTGVKTGWVIGPAHLIKAVRSVHQYTVFCSYNVIQNTVAKSLQVISQPQDTYMKDYAQKLTKHRNILLEELINCKYDFDLWIPKGGNFVLADISRIEVMEKYKKDENGNVRTKDYAFCTQLAYQNGVVAIPCSPLYAKQDSHLGQRYIRFAFCKDEQIIREAGKRMRK